MTSKIQKVAMLGAPIVRRFKAAFPAKKGSASATADDGSPSNPSSRPTLTQRFQDFFPWKEEGERPAFLQRFRRIKLNGDDMAQRTKPTAYPHLPFHALRFTQLISSIIVMSIMSYFLWHLHHDGYSSPWTFILLLTVSVFTIVTLSITIVLHLFYGLNPRLNVVLNAGLLFIWLLGFILLSWWSSSTLGHACSLDRWENGTGIKICQLYKALFAFSMFGLISTLAAALLDIYVFKRSVARGSYNQMHDLPELDQKVGAPLPSPRRFQENNEPYDSTAMKSPFPESTAYDPPNPKGQSSTDGSRSPYEGSVAYDPPKLSRESTRSSPFEAARVSHDTPKPSAEVPRSQPPSQPHSPTGKKPFSALGD